LFAFILVGAHADLIESKIAEMAAIGRLVKVLFALHGFLLLHLPPLRCMLPARMISK
jgi:hypothetical protein